MTINNEKARPQNVPTEKDLKTLVGEFTRSYWNDWLYERLVGQSCPDHKADVVDVYRVRRLSS